MPKVCYKKGSPPDKEAKRKKEFAELFHGKKIPHRIGHPMRCYWCRQKLNEETLTKDHLVSRPLSRRTGVARGHYVACCTKCNGERSVLSCLFQSLSQKNKDRMKKRASRLKKTREDLRPLLDRYTKLITDKLKGGHVELYKVCIYELDFIRDWEPPGAVKPAQKKPTEDQIRARAKQIWENAGKPVGLDVHFWLYAERLLKEECAT